MQHLPSFWSGIRASLLRGMKDGENLNTHDAFRTRLPSDTAMPDTSSVRIFDEASAQQILDRVQRFAKGGGECAIQLDCWWSGELRWARNRVSLGSDRRDITVKVVRHIEPGAGNAETNQMDDISLESAVRAAERLAHYSGSMTRDIHDVRVDAPPFPMPSPKIWSDATANVTAEARAALARTLSEQSEAQGMFAAGYMEMRIGARVLLDPTGGKVLDIGNGEWPKTMRYDQHSDSRCSMTVRHPKGVGSGWAGLSGYDWAAIDAPRLAKRALEKCLASLNPVAIEPGRYTVVLEPQAVSELVMFPFTRIRYFDRYDNEQSQGPLTLGPDPAIKKIRTKLGLKIVDERITISHDLMDPQQGVLPAPDARRIVWIDRGMLTTLGHGRDYALRFGLGEGRHSGGGGGLHMTGGTTSIDEMITTTKRGLLVTRFSDLMALDPASALLSGVTRDGLWLIENGKIAKAVKNMRITESPFFVLNQIEQLGVPVPVFSHLGPAIFPPIKARDFSFTAMIDAI